MSLEPPPAAVEPDPATDRHRTAGVVLGWLAVAALIVDAVLLAAYELFYLPLHLPRSMGGWAFPLSALVAAVTMPVLVRAAAAVAPRPGWAAAPLLAWFLTIVPIGVAGPGGDRVLPGDWRAMLLVAAGTLTGGVVLGRLMARRVLDG